MSLRAKILLLFLALAIAPLLTVAGFAYVQARRALDSVVVEGVRSHAEQVSRAIEDRLGAVGADLDALAAGRMVERVFDDGSARVDPPLLEGLERWRGAHDGAVAFLAFRDGPGNLLLLSGRTPPPPLRATSCGPQFVPLRLAHAASGGSIEAWVSLPALVPSLWSTLGEAGTLAVVDHVRSRVMFATDCDRGRRLAAAQAELSEESDAPSPASTTREFRFDRGDTLHVAAASAIPSLGWSVASSADPSEFRAPFRSLQIGFGLFVLLIALGTGFAFHALLGRVMSSLEDLTRAADRIGAGDLAPWLPLPGSDEVGRLSLAIGKMTDRLGVMMRQVDRSGRMAVVGELASYLAHEIRNPLSSIKLNLQGLRRDLRRDGVDLDAERAIDISLREVARLDGVVSSVLRLGRARAAEKRPCRIHQVVREAIELLRPELERDGVRVELRLDAGSDAVLADASQLKGVFLNLIVNAADAMPDGGLLAVDSEILRGEGDSDRLALSVADTGEGVPPHLRGRIFEPFFTTKEDGSGIGLPLALRIVEDHGGTLELESRPPPGVSTVFIVRLPLASSPWPGRPDHAPPTPLHPGGQEALSAPFAPSPGIHP